MSSQLLDENRWQAIIFVMTNLVQRSSHSCLSSLSAAEALPHWNTPGLYWAQLARPEPMMSSWWMGQQYGDQQVSEMRNSRDRCVVVVISSFWWKGKVTAFFWCASPSSIERTMVCFGECVPTKAGLKLHVASLKILRHGWRFSCGAAEEFW